MKKIWISVGLLACICAACLWKEADKFGKSKTFKQRNQKTVIATKESQKLSMTMPQMVIVLDPGHGGSEKGAVCKYGKISVQEKNINLKIAKYMKKELESYQNVKVYLTRDHDETVKLEKRVEKAAKDQADVFISLHNNAKGEALSYQNGCTVIVPTGNYRSKTSKKGQLLGVYFLDSLEQLGIENQGLLFRTSQTNTKYPNGELCDYYNVIKNCIYHDITGIIVEHAFIDSQSDYKKFLSSEEKIKQIAKKDAQAVFRCYGEKENEEVKTVKEKITLITNGKNQQNKYQTWKFKLKK